MPIPALLGTEETSPPPTPLLVGIPILAEYIPDALYKPVVIIKDLVKVAAVPETIRSLSYGLTPSLAKKAPKLAKLRAVTIIEHCLK